MKKISVAFDGLKFCRESMNYGIELASRSKGLLNGIFLDDFLYHSYNVFNQPGTEGIDGDEIKRLKAEDEGLRTQSISIFDSACRTANINYAIHRDKSFAINELLRESIYSDLLVIGLNETLSHLHELPPTPFIRNLLAGVQCPVLVVPPESKLPEKVFLLYDGKPSSVFAIKMFSYLMPGMKGIPTEIVSVADSSDSAEFPNEALIKEFVECYYPDATYTLLSGVAKTEIPQYLEKASAADLVVLGAYNRTAVSRWFKPSMADTLMERFDFPLFIAHNKP